jgi:hypothetical protein
MLHNGWHVFRTAAAQVAVRLPGRSRRTGGGRGEWSGGALSFALHLAAILLLAWWHPWTEQGRGPLVVVVEPFVEDLAVSLPTPTATAAPAAAPGPVSLFEPSVAISVVESIPEVRMPPTGFVAGEEPAAPRPSGASGPDLWLPVPGATGGGFGGRDPKSRARLVSQRGGTPQSEDAVSRGLAWLAAHQREDGSWRFNHHDGPCGGLCANPGSAGSTTAATGLALLPFLGAGETIEGSQYRDTVSKGLYYLTGRMIVTPQGGDLQEGTMYAQGIATVALCEAYAMTRDESLRSPAQAAVDFICRAQHDQGGWRYYPGQPGDTTVYGWQIMALKSARLAELRVPEAVWTKARQFLDTVQVDEGAGYGYQKPERLPGPTAIGLLARMYDGWPQADPRLAAGVNYLSKLGPSRTDVYYDYYATQVLHHYEGPAWDAWNAELRERLIATQSRRGHEHGSWYFRDQHGEVGGRLYTTAMCVMILEVYYRHLPLYGREAVRED